MDLLKWFRKKKRLIESVDVGTGRMFITLKTDPPGKMQGFSYSGFQHNGYVVHAKYVLETQLKDQASMGFFKLHDGKYLNKDEVSSIEIACDAYIVEKERK